MLATQHDVVHGRRVHFLREGPREAPTVVFLHGYPDTLHIFDRVVAELSEDHDVIALDWPGLGESEGWPGGGTPAVLAGRLLELLDHWEVDRAVLCGHDMGAHPALVLAARHQGRVSHLVPMNCLAWFDAPTSWELRILREHGWNRFFIENFGLIVYLRAVFTFLPLGTWLPRELSAVFWSAWRRAEVRGYVSRMCAGYQGTLHRLPDDYARIEVPTLVLWGEHDKHFPTVHGRKLHEHVRHSVLQVVPGAHHWMVWTHAPQVARAIRQFVAQES